MTAERAHLGLLFNQYSPGLNTSNQKKHFYIPLLDDNIKNKED
jgi:hypothetical protein